MNDIDFDELDKAVNSLVTKKSGASSQPASAEPSGAQAIPEPQARPQPEAVTSPNPAEVAHVKVSAAVTPNRRSRLVAAKPVANRGSFIDIMAPKPMAKPSRTGQTIQPTSPQPVKPETTAMPEEPKPTEPQPSKPEPVKSDATKPSEAKQKSQDQAEVWPDPLDFHGQEKSAEPGALPASDLEDEPTKKPEQPTTPAPTSPFIEGAKVEKRPLGAFTQYVAAAGKEEPASEPKAEKPAPKVEPEVMSEDLSDLPDTNLKATPIPDELRPDVVAVESGEKKETEEQSESTEKADQAPQNEVVHEHEQPSRQALHDTAMLSIPKQYKTTEKPADSSARPVFDTKEYHPPLLEATAHAAHRGSMWGKLFLTLLIVVLLAVGGYFAFIYFIENF